MKIAIKKASGFLPKLFLWNLLFAKRIVVFLGSFVSWARTMFTFNSFTTVRAYIFVATKTYSWKFTSLVVNENVSRSAIEKLKLLKLFRNNISFHNPIIFKWCIIIKNMSDYMHLKYYVKR